MQTRGDPGIFDMGCSDNDHTHFRCAYIHNINTHYALIISYLTEYLTLFLNHGVCARAKIQCQTNLQIFKIFSNGNYIILVIKNFLQKSRGSRDDEAIKSTETRNDDEAIKSMETRMHYM